jgi:uncharacterized OB-fold protein
LGLLSVRPNGCKDCGQSCLPPQSLSPEARARIKRKIVVEKGGAGL